MGTKLSKILDSLHKLQNIDCDSHSRETDNFISKINNALNGLSVINHSDLKSCENKLKNALEEYLTVVRQFEGKLNFTVYSNKKDYIKQSEIIYKENIEKMLFEEELIWAKNWPPKSVELENFHNNIINYCNWQYGGLIIGAKDSPVLESVVATEPFYMIERFDGYLNLLKERFHPDFIRKVKYYLVEDIKKLPNNSLGLIVVFNEFNFIPWNITANLLNELSKKLIAGGKLIFNYNNCNTLKGFTNFENSYMVYTTPDMFDNALKNYQLSCIQKYDSDLEAFSFLIYQKAGQKQLIKKYPSVGFIKQQPTLLKKELHEKRLEKVRKLVNLKNTY